MSWLVDVDVDVDVGVGVGVGVGGVPGAVSLVLLGWGMAQLPPGPVSLDLLRQGSGTCARCRHMLWVPYAWCGRPFA